MEESYIYEEFEMDLSVVIASEPQLELFDESNKIRIPKVNLPLRSKIPIEGADIF